MSNVYMMNAAGKPYMSRHGGVETMPAADGWRKVSKQQYDDAVKADAIKTLRAKFKPGQRVGTMLAHISSSGMSRSIKVLVGNKDGSVSDVSYLIVAAGIGTFDNKNGGVKIGGCGMDMGFHLIHCLGAALWPKGTRKPHSTRNGKPDNSGGYALKQYWI